MSKPVFFSLLLGLLIPLMIHPQVHELQRSTLEVERVPDPISGNLADMTVRDLLVMTSGVTPDWNMRNVIPDCL